MQENLSASAIGRYPGVAEDQFLQYRFTQQDLAGNDTEWMSHRPEGSVLSNITVVGVSGSILTIHHDGATSDLDVETGLCTPHPLIPLFLAANLNAGEPIYVSSSDWWKNLPINETITTDYLGLPLETNHLNFNETFTNLSYWGMVSNVTAVVDYYWDKGTGSLVRGIWVEHSCRPDGGSGVLVSVQKIETEILSANPMFPQFPPQDTTPPTVFILYPENKTYSANYVSLVFTLSEPTSWIGFSLDGQTNVTLSGNTTLVDIPDGTHALMVYANDTSGNMGSSNALHFTIDTTPCNIEILSPENITYTTSSLSLIFTIDEPASWIGYSLDGQANITITGNRTLSGLLDGQHSIIVCARDIAGNTELSDRIYFSTNTEQTEPLLSTFELAIVAIAAIVIISGSIVFVLYRRKKPSSGSPSPQKTRNSLALSGE